MCEPFILFGNHISSTNYKVADRKIGVHLLRMSCPPGFKLVLSFCIAFRFVVLGRICNSIVLVHDHCRFLYFAIEFLQGTYLEERNINVKTVFQLEMAIVHLIWRWKAKKNMLYDVSVTRCWHTKHIHMCSQRQKSSFHMMHRDIVRSQMCDYERFPPYNNRNFEIEF